MSNETHLSVLTYNCWGLHYFSEYRRDRLTAIGRYLSDASHGYDLVALQEVWVYEDFVLVRSLVKDSFPFTKHWTSGLFGSGLVVLSKYPIMSTSIRRFALNGDPGRRFHGDWFDGKSCASAVILHPRIGEVEVFNTHLHATYDPVGTLDAYLGCRLAQAWEMCQLIRRATALGRLVVALGDYNSAPGSLVVQLLTRYACLTDSWGSLNPFVPPQSSQPTPGVVDHFQPMGLSAEEGVLQLGITCDTPLNSYTNHAKWTNALTGDPIGERLDYIFFSTRKSFTSGDGGGSGSDTTGAEIRCERVQVVLQEKIPGIGGGGKAETGLKHMSDHFAVHAVFSMVSPRTSTSARVHINKPSMEEENDEAAIKLLENVLLALEQHRRQARMKSKQVLWILMPMVLVALVSLFVGLARVVVSSTGHEEANRLVLSPLSATMALAGLSVMSSGWVLCMVYGFFYGGETESAFVNVIQEVQAELQLVRAAPVSPKKAAYVK